MPTCQTHRYSWRRQLKGRSRRIGDEAVYMIMLTAQAAAVPEEFSPSQAMSTLLATESFLLATVSLTATLAAPGRRRVARLPVSGAWLGALAAVAVCVAGIGALTAWAVIFTGGSLRPFPEVVIAGCLLLVIVTQPLLAVALALGLRSER